MWVIRIVLYVKGMKHMRLREKGLDWQIVLAPRVSRSYNCIIASNWREATMFGNINEFHCNDLAGFGTVARQAFLIRVVSRLGLAFARTRM